MKMKLFYYSGAGNLFSIFDNREYGLSPEQLARVSQIACKKTDDKTIRTEGFIAVNKVDGKKINVSFFNPDGSTGMMCGNGARSVVSYIDALGLVKTKDTSSPQEIIIQMAGKEYHSIIHDKLITVKFPKHNELKLNFEIDYSGMRLYGDFVDVGSPHILLDFSKLLNAKKYNFRNFPLEELARPIRYNQKIFPDGVNVSIYDIESPSTVHLRTYERGVEMETGACGTASISAALVLFVRKKVEKKITIIPTSRIPLEVEVLTNNDNEIIGFNLTGTAERLGEALIEI